MSASDTFVKTSRKLLLHLDDDVSGRDGDYDYNDNDHDGGDANDDDDNYDADDGDDPHLSSTPPTPPIVKISTSDAPFVRKSRA